MRAQLIDAFNVWLQVPAESIEVVKQVVGMLHTASLLCVCFYAPSADQTDLPHPQTHVQNG